MIIALAAYAAPSDCPADDQSYVIASNLLAQLAPSVQSAYGVAMLHPLTHSL